MEQLKHVLSRRNFKIEVRPVSTRKDQLMRPKGRVIKLKTGRIPCKDCNVQYIGEKGRALGTRQSEHERAVRLEHVEKSVLADYMWKNWIIQLHGMKYLCYVMKVDRHRGSGIRGILYQTGRLNAITNRDNGRELLDIYETILTNNRVFKNKWRC